MPPRETRWNLRPRARAIERPSEVLPTPGRSDEAEDRPLHVRLELEHAQVVEDAILHLLQAVVVVVEDFLRLVQIDLGARTARPGQRSQPLDVVAHQRGIGGHGRHAREPVQLLESLFLDVVGHSGGFNLLPQLVDISLSFIDFAKFFLNCL
jgi:hypothetical protein